MRLRRDFKALLTLIKAHALLHQAAHDRDGRGRIVACHEDYAEVRAIVIGLVSDAVKATVSPAVRETVAAVEGLEREPNKAQVTRHLGIDQSAGSAGWTRRWRRATCGTSRTSATDQRSSC